MEFAKHRQCARYLPFLVAFDRELARTRTTSPASFFSILDDLESSLRETMENILGNGTMCRVLASNLRPRIRAFLVAGSLLGLSQGEFEDDFQRALTCLMTYYLNAKLYSKFTVDTPSPAEDACITYVFLKDVFIRGSTSDLPPGERILDTLLASKICDILHGENKRFRRHLFLKVIEDAERFTHSEAPATTLIKFRALTQEQFPKGMQGMKFLKILGERIELSQQRGDAEQRQGPEKEQQQEQLEENQEEQEQVEEEEEEGATVETEEKVEEQFEMEERVEEEFEMEERLEEELEMEERLEEQVDEEEGIPFPLPGEKEILKEEDDDLLFVAYVPGSANARESNLPEPDPVELARFERRVKRSEKNDTKRKVLRLGFLTSLSFNVKLPNGNPEGLTSSGSDEDN